MSTDTKSYTFVRKLLEKILKDNLLEKILKDNNVGTADTGVKGTKGTKTAGSLFEPGSTIRSSENVIEQLSKATGKTTRSIKKALSDGDPYVTGMYNSEMENYKRAAINPKELAPSTFEYGVGIAAPAISNGIKLVGNVSAIKHGVPGNVLDAMYTASPKSNVSTNPLGMAAALAKAQTAKGAVHALSGDLISDTFDKTAQSFLGMREKERMLKTQQYYNPNTGYWQAYNGTTSDKHKLSDERMKSIYDKFGKHEQMTEADLLDLAAAAGIDLPETEDDTSQSVLDGYADNIANYLYQYKPEATVIDGSIDPDQIQIGPMAQDIEKVNPACIVETPEGIKTVDTGKLALMNSGAIADLAREVKEIKSMLGGK